MSYIDTFDYELIGYFGGLPVYHPLEAVPTSDGRPEDFACDPAQIVIGGGGGEHPGIVIVSPKEAAMHFLKAYLEQNLAQLEQETQLRLKQVVEPWAEDPERVFQCPWIKVFHFAGWKTEDYVKFYQRCTSPAFMRPYRPEFDGLLESWLAISVGEFLVLALPELIEPLILELADLKEKFTSDLYQNILLAPPGYPLWGRKEENGSVRWRLESWQIQRKSNPLTFR
jgi:hypothetical protein